MAPAAVADESKTTRDFTTYACIAFANSTTGLIAGWSKRPRFRRWPDWMLPESRPRELPSVSLLLDTHDGGAHWHVSEASLFGRVTQARLAPDGRGLNLIEFWDAFDWPAEVFRFDWHTGETARVFRQKDRAVTDLALPSQGPAYLAAIEPPGLLPRSPIPGSSKCSAATTSPTGRRWRSTTAPWAAAPSWPLPMPPTSGSPPTPE